MKRPIMKLLITGNLSRKEAKDHIQRMVNLKILSSDNNGSIRISDEFFNLVNDLSEKSVVEKSMLRNGIPHLPEFEDFALIAVAITKQTGALTFDELVHMTNIVLTITGKTMVLMEDFKERKLIYTGMKFDPQNL